jgi:hypothetical protein
MAIMRFDSTNDSEEVTLYEIIYTAVDEKPELQFISLKGMVGAKVFACPERAEGNLRPSRPGWDP